MIGGVVGMGRRSTSLMRERRSKAPEGDEERVPRGRRARRQRDEALDDAPQLRLQLRLQAEGVIEAPAQASRLRCTHSQRDVADTTECHGACRFNTKPALRCCAA